MEVFLWVALLFSWLLGKAATVDWRGHRPLGNE
jgi:hypothetical protein